MRYNISPLETNGIKKLSVPNFDETREVDEMGLIFVSVNLEG